MKRAFDLNEKVMYNNKEAVVVTYIKNYSTKEIKFRIQVEENGRKRQIDVEAKELTKIVPKGEKKPAIDEIKQGDEAVKSESGEVYPRVEKQPLQTAETSLEIIPEGNQLPEATDDVKEGIPETKPEELKADAEKVLKEASKETKKNTSMKRTKKD